MSSKTKRLLTIRKIIASSKISTQDELIQVLSEKGFELTQATLSRDLKYLKVGKTSDPEKGYIYFLPENGVAEKLDLEKASTLFPLSGVQSLKFSGNFGVLRTKSGYASSVATLIDSSNSYDILGTIAGDDTILIIPADGVSRNDLRNALIVMIPELEGRI